MAAASTGTSAIMALDVPLLVQVVSGNPATAVAVLPCLDTYDVTILRQLHPVLLHTLTGVSWCDTVTTVHDVRRWRDALPSALGARVTQLYPGTLALLAGLMALDMRQCDAVTDVIIQRLPPTLRHLVVHQCRNLTRAASFTHLPSLTLLDCGKTAALGAGLEALPPSLQELRMEWRGCRHDDRRAVLPAANFRHLRALRVLSWTWGTEAPRYASAATLPPTLEELDISVGGATIATASLAHLPRLRVLCAMYTSLTDAAVAALPPHVMELDVRGCHELTPAVSFANLRALRTLNASSTNMDDACLATLPPSLVSLDVSHCKSLSKDAALPELPALQLFDASNTGIGDALVASLPRSLTTLCLANCANVTPAVAMPHLAALRELQSSGTDLSLSTVAALRAHGCLAPAESMLREVPKHCIQTMSVLADGRVATGSWEGVVRLISAGITRDEAATAPVMTEHGLGMWITHFAVLPNSRRLAVAMRTNDWEVGRIEVWDAHTTPPTWCTAIAYNSGVLQMAVLRDGRLTAGCSNGRIWLVDVDSGTVGNTSLPVCHTKGVNALAVFPDGTLASGSYDKTVRVWEVGSGVCIAVLAGHQRSVCALAALASGHLASAGDDCVVRLWDAATWTCYAVLSPVDRVGDAVTSLALVALPDGRLACGDWDGVIRVWDTHTCLPSRDGDAAIRRRAAARCVVAHVAMEGRAGSVDAMVLLPDGRLVSGGRHDRFRVWRLPPLQSPPGPPSMASPLV